MFKIFKKIVSFDMESFRYNVFESESLFSEFYIRGTVFFTKVPLFRITYNLWEKTKVETLSAVYTKNQNSKTVIKTIIDGGHLWKIIDQK